MQKVSDSFKKAIKSDVRDIYAYIDVIYDDETNDSDYYVEELPTPSILSYPTGDDMFDGIKIMKNYGTLENNYFLLNGSFMLPNKNVLYDSNGYSSDKVFYENESNTFDISVDNANSKGITLYFKDNLIFDYDVILTDDNDEEHLYEMRNNTSYHPQIVFENNIIITNIKLNILKVEYNDRRIRIPEIDFSISDIYNGDELVNFDVTEEIDLLVESLPINTCSINLNNYPDSFGGNKFDPLNPIGIVPYLTENTVIRPYIGVLTEENGIEYVLMGTFYLNDWSSDVDGNITLNGQSLMKRLADTTITSDGTFLKTRFTGNTLASYFSKITGYQFNFVSGTYTNYYLRHTNLLDWIKSQMPFQIMWYNESTGEYSKRKFHITRDNIASEDHLIDDVVESISRKELIQDLKYETKSVVREVDIVDITSYSRSSSTTENVVDDNHTLSENVEYLWYYFDKYSNYSSSQFSYSVVSGSGKAELIDSNYYMAYIKFTGTPGSVINVKYKAYIYDDVPTKKWVFTNDYKSGDVLNLDFHEYFNADDEYLKSSADYYLTEDRKYKVTANTIGDPSLEPGDTISIQTRYKDVNNGYKDVVITKQKFTYNGGLSCELEGRGN